MLPTTVPVWNRPGPGSALGLVANRQAHFASMGAFIFVVSHGSPSVTVWPDGDPGREVVEFEGRPQVVALLPTTDKFEVVRLVGTSRNRPHDSGAVSTWVRELDRTQSFALLGAGIDFVEGFFLSPVGDPVALAHNVHAFCPDFWHQGLGLSQPAQSPEAGIASYFEAERYFFFWWD